MVSSSLASRQINANRFRPRGPHPASPMHSKATSGAGASARERVYAFRTLLLLDCRSLCLYGSIRF